MLSFAGGADCFNVADLLRSGMRTITVCSDLLKSGGYLRMLQYMEKVDAAYDEVGAVDTEDFICRTALRQKDVAEFTPLMRYASLTDSGLDLTMAHCAIGNTSSISITKIAAATARPERVIGMHFMNPVPLMKLVEIIKGLATSDETYEITRVLSTKLGKTPVPANDFPGFISNRILMPMINEAVYCLFEGVGTPQDIDEIMKLGMNHPMGPLTLADLIGLDTCLAIMQVLHAGLGDAKYRPCPLLIKYVDAGWLGRKSGRGFYKY
ncbi:MAG: 3-hydroxyacyl-CoA dehydrogenase family protein [Desulfatiglandales bacterium]